MQPVKLHALDRDLVDVEPVEVHLGSWSATVPVDRSRPGELHLPRHLFLQWPLVAEQTVGMWESPNRRHLHLGPVIGLIWDGSRDRWWKLLQQLGKGAQAAGAVPVFFSVLDADLENGNLPAALCPGADGEWETRTCPLPDVIYDRGTYPDPSVRSTARWRRNRLARVFDIPFVNTTPAFDKWDTYRTVEFFSETKGLCPETALLDDRQSLLAFIRRHKHVFVKNTWGTWGREVLSIEALRPNEFHLYGYLSGRRINTGLSRRALWPWLQERCATGSWIVQQAVDRQPLQGRLFDFRIVLQKDGDGVWQIPHVLINWAKRGEMISNRPKTSEFLTDAEFRPHWGDRAFEFDALAARAKHLSLLVAAALETRYGRLGELGLDIAPDRTGRPWLLEANAKPYFMPGEGDRLPFLYARHLAETVWSGQYSGLPELTENGGPSWHAAYQSI